MVKIVTESVVAPRIAGPNPPPTIVFLHGWKENEETHLPIVDSVDPACLFISVRAPMLIRPDAYAWCNVELTPNGPADDACEAEESRLALIRYLETLPARHGTQPDSTYLYGFSQGAVIAMMVALTAPRLIAGVAGFCGRVIPEYLPGLAPAEALRQVRLFMANGTEDTILPLRHAQAARDALLELGMRLHYREYECAHTLTPAMLRDVESWRVQTTTPGGQEAPNGPRCR